MVLSVNGSVSALLDLKTLKKKQQITCLTLKTHGLHSHAALKPTVKASAGNHMKTNPNTYFLLSLFFFLVF